MTIKVYPPQYVEELEAELERLRDLLRVQTDLNVDQQVVNEEQAREVERLRAALEWQRVEAERQANNATLGNGRIHQELLALSESARRALEEANERRL